MYKNGGYAGDDRMCDLVCDRYAVLQVMSRFGIALGFGDKTIAEVCAESRVDAATFLAVVNMLMNFGNGAELAGEVSVRSLTDYLHNSHGYFLDFRLPAIRRKLIEAVDCALSDVSFAIMRFFDEYAAEVQRHMSYEEQTVFPYVESLLSGEKNTAYSIDIFRRQHDQIDIKLRELKNIIIKYYPSGSSNELNGVLFDIFNCEHELASHNAVEDELFIPAVERLAAAGPRTVKPEPLSAREKEIIVCVVKGMTNKQIADALCISAHTVITHRRNIAAKLQIHSAAGLTIYAIVNKLVELSEIKDTITDPPLLRLDGPAVRCRAQPFRRRQPAAGHAGFPAGAGAGYAPLHLWLQEKHGADLAVELGDPADRRGGHRRREHRPHAASRAGRRRRHRLDGGRRGGDQRLHGVAVSEGQGP